MPDAFQNWAQGFHNFFLTGIGVAIVLLIGNAGYRRHALPFLESVVARARRWLLF